MSVNNYSKINNTYMENINFPVLKITGYVVPTAVGIYSVLDLNGNAIEMLPNNIILGVSMQSVVPIVGGTTLDLGLSSTSGGTIGTNILNETVANVNLGITVQPTIGSSISTTNNFLVVSNLAVITAGKILINIIYINPIAN